MLNRYMQREKIINLRDEKEKKKKGGKIVKRIQEKKR